MLRHCAALQNFSVLIRSQRALAATGGPGARLYSAAASLTGKKLLVARASMPRLGASYLFFVSDRRSKALQEVLRLMRAHESH